MPALGRPPVGLRPDPATGRRRCTAGRAGAAASSPSTARTGPARDAGRRAGCSSRWHRSQPRSVRASSWQRSAVASRAGLAGLAGSLGKRVACHLRDPLRCRLAVRGMAGRRCLPSWRWSRQWDVVALTAYARPGPALPDRLRRRHARQDRVVSSGAQPQDSVTPAPPCP